MTIDQTHLRALLDKVSKFEPGTWDHQMALGMLEDAAVDALPELLDELDRLRSALAEACDLVSVGLVTDYGFNYEASVGPRSRVAELRALAIDAARGK